ncbi:RNA methyltransferase [Terrihabitans rhizophilus]|uniref:RNA methyltransferase n=1 Tax=Terrihabitans rhizophilus TaxID=3092662 RepID=A0ABU4RXE7_9HYPH|nr:RNA methyltransferase [Terrihabitans sp. PJ23]MDX6807586.1 RNA methyltransferase [Terrihabitans sp. PJ23]
MSRPPRSAGAKTPNRFSRPGNARPRRDEDDDTVILYGFHPVIEALNNPSRKIRRLLATENAIKRLAEEGVQPKVQPEIVRPGDIDRLLTPDSVHQGLYAEADALPQPRMRDLPDTGIVLVLDQVTDPHNVGAILRTAAAFAVDAIMTTNRHSPAATGVLAKAASGALEHVPFITVTNLSRGLDELAERGYRRVGLDSDAPENLDDISLAPPLALVLGAEGKGLRQKTREYCDVLARMDMPGAIRSLNVSNAAAIALHAAHLARSR